MVSGVTSKHVSVGNNAKGVVRSMEKRRVAVLMGGVSSEHEVSLKSGAMVAGSLDRNKYDITPVVVSMDGKWKFPGERHFPIGEAVMRLQRLDLACIFLAFHGAYGEDGRIQGFLDQLGIPYTGSGCAASALAMDKIRAKAVAMHGGVRAARHVIVTRDVWDDDSVAVLERVEAELGFPCVIKSPCQGSSIGMAIPRASTDFGRAMLQVFDYGDALMIEEYVEGTEVTCGVFDLEPGKAPQAFPVTEIRPVSAEFFDYEAKYTPGASEEITPAEIPEAVAREVQDMAILAHTLIGCRGLTRSDMIIANGEPVWIEINTIPGITETSLCPQAAAVAGIPFPEFLSRQIEGALAWAQQKGD